MKRVQACQETINKQYKQWGIFAQCFHHDFRVHCDVFAAISVLSQLAIKNGKPLFVVDYSDSMLNAAFLLARSNKGITYKSIKSCPST